MKIFTNLPQIKTFYILELLSGNSDCLIICKLKVPSLLITLRLTKALAREIRRKTRGKYEGLIEQRYATLRGAVRLLFGFVIGAN